MGAQGLPYDHSETLEADEQRLSEQERRVLDGMDAEARDEA